MDELTREFIAESQEGLGRMELCLTELEKRPSDNELVAEIFRTVHTIKGTTGFLGFGRLEKLAHAGEDLLGAVRDKKLAVTTKLIDGLLSLLDGLRNILLTIEATGTEGVRSVEDDCGLIERMAQLKTVGGTLAAATGSASRDGDAARPEMPAAIYGVAVAADSSMQDKTLRIDVEVLNRMMNLVGELVLTRNHILRCSPGSENFPGLARRLDSVTAELRESVMRARVQPVGHLFRKFPRMMRDLAAVCARQVRIELEGQETGLDKSLLEAIRDPLTHAVRNAVDHGIEPPEERVKAGKPAEGVVRLRAFQQNGFVVIEVTDDGAGIATGRVLAKAIERGLLTAEQAGSMTPREVLQLIFVAGFSTAKTVTNISGRGMGMDVVRTNVEKVGGSVELESCVGSGTTVRMRVPLTLAIIPALVVRSGGESFALPQNSLAELVYVPQREAGRAVERIGTTEYYRLREGLLPLVRLDRLLGLEPDTGAEADGFYIAEVESEGRRFGLVVDDLNVPEEIVVKPLSAELREIGIFSGATVLGNGTLALILDIAATGARARVRPAVQAARDVDAELTQAEATHANAARSETDISMLIYETGEQSVESGVHRIAQGVNRGRMGMPLSAVERIESVPVRAIEYAGGRAVLQYRDELIPLVDDGGILRDKIAAGETAESGVREAETRARGPGIHSQAPERMVTVLICLRQEARGARRVGMVVRRVVDVSKGTLLAADAANGEERLALLNSRVTTVHSEFSGWLGTSPMEIMKEVA